jgi:hypothetical protein
VSATLQDVTPLAPIVPCARMEDVEILLLHSDAL